MKGRCQTCGATAPLDWFLTEPVARQMLGVALKLPQVIQGQLLPYLSLYNPVGGTMQSKKALRLTLELAALVAAGHVGAPGKVVRPCPPRIWAQAMEQMIERRAALRLPLKNHAYMQRIAWGLADAEDAKREQQHHESAATGGGPRVRRQAPDDGLLPIERAMRESKQS